MTDNQGSIHDEHPFAAPPSQRDPMRQLRGRLAAPVTVITAGSAENRVALTVSSLMLAEGEPARVHFLLGITTDLYYAVEDSKRFVVHVLESSHQQPADRFAGLAPSPGGPFAGLEVLDGEYGPEIAAFPTRAYCRYEGGPEGTLHVLASGIVDRVVLHDLESPLVYFRGGYRTLATPPGTRHAGS